MMLVAVLTTFAAIVTPAAAANPDPATQAVVPDLISQEELDNAPAAPLGTDRELARDTFAASVAKATSAEDCDALNARVLAQKSASHPENCVSVEIDDDATPAGKASLAALDLPEECGSFAEPSGIWYGTDRRNVCSHRAIELIVRAVPSGAIVGTANIHAITTVTAVGSSVSSTIRLWVWSVTGTGSPQLSTGTLFGCPGDCIGTGTTYAPGGVGEWNGTGAFAVQPLAVGEVLTWADGMWELTFSSALWSNTAIITLPALGPRCDNAQPGRAQGCVYEDIAGIAAFSYATNPDFADHVGSAIATGLPGGYLTGTYLTRMQNPTLSDLNGSTACPSSIPRPTGYSCDEYPFRSTYEGAYTSSTPGVARSFSWCQMPDSYATGPNGWSRCFIPASQNSSAGGFLSAFYANERMMDGDRFQVAFLA